MPAFDLLSPGGAAFFLVLIGVLGRAADIGCRRPDLDVPGGED